MTSRDVWGRRGFGTVAVQFCICEAVSVVLLHPTTSMSRLYGGGINCPVTPHDTNIFTTESRSLRIWEVLGSFLVSSVPL